MGILDLMKWNTDILYFMVCLRGEWIPNTCLWYAGCWQTCWMLKNGVVACICRIKNILKKYVVQVIFQAFKLRDWKSVDWLLKSQKDPRYWVVISVVLWRSNSINSPQFLFLKTCVLCRWIIGLSEINQKQYLCFHFIWDY